MNRQPVLTAASVAAVLTALVALLKSFGVPITDDQALAITGFVGLVAPIAAALYARSKVTPVVPVTPLAPRDERGQSALVWALVGVGIVLVVFLLVGALHR